jgi:hypothetical protein
VQRKDEFDRLVISLLSLQTERAIFGTGTAALIGSQTYEIIIFIGDGHDGVVWEMGGSTSMVTGRLAGGVTSCFLAWLGGARLLRRG